MNGFDAYYKAKELRREKKCYVAPEDSRFPRFFEDGKDIRPLFESFWGFKTRWGDGKFYYMDPQGYWDMIDDGYWTYYYSGEYTFRAHINDDDPEISVIQALRSPRPR